jgi:diguanylate cyclase (GGDEF)-like protein
VLRRLRFCRVEAVPAVKSNVAYLRSIHEWRQWLASARARVAVPGVFSSWSISTRLLVAFASVAVLAAAANFIAERSASIVARPALVPTPPPPSLVTREAAAPVVETPAPVATLSGEELTRSIERFDESVYAAVQSGSVETQERYRHFGKEVDRATAQFMDQAQALGDRSYKSVPAAIQQHKRNAERWIQLAQDRRQLLREYSEKLEHMNGRLNASLDGAFKIFGRVVARQSLVQLNTSLSGLRDSFAAAVRSFSTAPEVFDRIGEAEAAFGQSLQDNAKSLRRAESDEWFAEMEQDFATLTALRLALVKTHQDLMTTANDFVAQTKKLLARMPKGTAQTSRSGTTARMPQQQRDQQKQQPQKHQKHQLMDARFTDGTTRQSTPADETRAVGTPAVTTTAVGTRAVAPAVQTPAVGTPGVGTPAVRTPAAGSPAARTPAVKTSAVRTPTVGTPTDGRPTVGTVAVGTPAVGTLAVEAHAVKTPAGGETPADEAPADAAAAARTVSTSVPPNVGTLAPEDQSDRSVVAWISIAVLALLLWISIATVRSVVVPVRRLIAASEKIAAGEAAARVPRGGIKELDSLAVAFNNMAERLSQAQAVALDAHHQLEEKVAERTRQLQQLAELDPLTGLPNRRQLFNLLNASLQRASQTNRRVGVLFLDVDNFKNINDSIGHSFGDRVLRGIAQRLQSAAQPLGFAARLGGDEFTVICEDAGDLEQIHAASEQIIRAFQTPIDVDGRELIIGVSVGASIYPDHEQDAEALLIAADTALFQTKTLGRGRASMFTPELRAHASNKFRIEQDLRRAIERAEFELFFQPEVGIEDLQTQLVEALIRWRTPDGRYVPPGEFLSVAEESGLIIEISDWVLRTAIRAAAEWHRGPWPQARVAINVSPRQLLDYRFVDRVRELLAEFDLPSRCIEIELTESVLQTGRSTIEQLHRLRALGIAIALDDFGTGYSSLSSLERLPLTRVKLDRSLIESIDSNARSRSIVRAMIDMCNGLGLQVTAEGLERAEQFERFLGCKNLSLQGYLLSRPVAMDQVFTAMANAAQRAQELVLLSKPNAVATVIKQLPAAPNRSASA